MSNKNSIAEVEQSETEISETEIDDPTQLQEMIKNLVEDITLDNPPDLLASDFIDEFVLRQSESEATTQILIMMEQPTETLVQALKQIISQAYETQLELVDERGYRFLEGLKAEIKKQMTELANS
jgi:hypothetical protein